MLGLLKIEHDYKISGEQMWELIYDPFRVAGVVVFIPHPTWLPLYAAFRGSGSLVRFML